MNRVELIPSKRLESTIVTCKSLIEHLKNKQFMGYDSTRPSRNATPAPYDYSLSGYQYLQIEFAPNNRDSPMAQLRFEFYKDTVGNLAEEGDFEVGVQRENSVYPLKWGVNAYNTSGSGNLLIKVFVLSNDTGAVTCN